jgi:imidazolonepropionase-like amidohydrolase
MASSPVPADSFVFIERGYVVVDSGKITHVDSGDYPELSATVSVISKPGYALLPGLIDAHVHGLGGNVLCIEQALRFGVTTVCDMHNEPQHISKLREVRVYIDKF